MAAMGRWILDHCHAPGCRTPLYELTPTMLCTEHQEAAEAEQARRERVARSSSAPAASCSSSPA
jgi:hypothetical protein